MTDPIGRGAALAVAVYVMASVLGWAVVGLLLVLVWG
jgi:hypothetical protein